MPDVEQVTFEEEEEYDQPVVYYSGFCEFLHMEDFRWHPQGEGTFRLLRNSEGAKFFQFWQNEQLLVEDYISGLVLRLGQSVRAWRWHNPEYADGLQSVQFLGVIDTPVVLVTTGACVGPDSAEIRRYFAVLDKAVGMPLVCRYCGSSAVTVHRQFGSRACRHATTGADGPDSAGWS